MLISNIASVASLAFSAIKSLASPRQDAPAETASYADKVSISAVGRAMMARSTESPEEAAIQSRLDVIKSKPAVERTTEESNFVRDNDKRLKDLAQKDPSTLTADELDYMQKAMGLLNTMASLLPSEKAQYDSRVAMGDKDGIAAMQKVALSRTLA